MRQLSDEIENKEKIKEEMFRLPDIFRKIEQNYEGQLSILKTDDFDDEEYRYQIFKNLNLEIDLEDKKIEKIVNDISKLGVSEYEDAKFSLKLVHDHYRMRQDHFDNIELAIENFNNKHLYQLYIDGKRKQFKTNEEKWRKSLKIKESEYLVTMVSDAFDREQIVDQKMPGKNDELWKKGDKVSYRDLALKLPKILEKNHVQISCVIASINLAEGEINVDVQITHENYSKTILVAMSGFIREETIIKKQLQKYLDFYDDSEDGTMGTLSRANLFKFTRGNIISSEDLDTDEPEWKEFYKVEYLVHECFPTRGVLSAQVKIIHTKTNLHVEKVVIFDGFESKKGVIDHLHEYFEQFNLKNPFNLQGRISLENKWWDALQMLQENLDKYRGDGSHEGLFKHLTFQADKIASFDLPLKETIDYKNSSIDIWVNYYEWSYWGELVHKEVIGKFKLYFSGIDFGKTPKIMAIGFREKEMELEVGPTWDTDSKEMTLELINNFAQKHTNWETFIRHYNQLKFSDFDYTVHSSMETFNHSKIFEMLENNTIQLDAETLGVEKTLFSRSHDEYTEAQNTKITFTLHVNKLDQLVAVVKLYGYSRSKVSKIYLYISIKMIEFS